jgi:hypothetical protein
LLSIQVEVIGMVQSRPQPEDEPEMSLGSEPAPLREAVCMLASSVPTYSAKKLEDVARVVKGSAPSVLPAEHLHALGSHTPVLSVNVADPLFGSAVVKALLNVTVRDEPT